MLYPKDPLEVDVVPLGCLIEELPIMVFYFLRNTKRELMVGVLFVLFVLTKITYGDES